MADDPDDTMDDDLDDADDDNGSEGASGDEWEPPSKEEWDRTVAALTKANGQAKKHRLKVRELEGKSNASAPPSGGPDLEEVRRKATEEAQSKADQRIIKSEAKTALLAAGLVDATPEAVKAAVKMLDTDDLSVDDDGEVDGLDEAIATLKRTMPALFKKKRAGGQVATGSRGKDGGANGSKPPAKSSAAKLAGALTRG